MWKSKKHDVDLSPEFEEEYEKANKDNLRLIFVIDIFVLAICVFLLLILGFKYIELHGNDIESSIESLKIKIELQMNPPSNDVYWDSEGNYNIALTTDGNDYTRSLCNNELKSIPNEMKELFTNSGWKYNVADLNLNDMLSDVTDRYEKNQNTIIGLTVPVDKTIYVLATDYAAKHASIHEFGHWIDLFLGKASNNDNWQEVRSKDIVNLYGKTELVNFQFNIGYEEEIFADAFWMYITDPNIDELCPNITSYFDMICEEMVNFYYEAENENNA